jgi:6-pyruvoyltetrahydropterin/6-carboxytetrahydropterin synthase
MRVRMTRRVGFSSGHRYWNPGLSADENRDLFGSWASPFSHGHNYFLEVTVDGEVDRSTGMLVNIKRLDDLLKQRIVSNFDGKSINDEIPAFHHRAPSVENLLEYIKTSLVRDPDGDRIAISSTAGGDFTQEIRLTTLRLEETPLFFGELAVSDNAMTLTRIYEFAASHRLHSPDLSESENLALFGKCNNPAGHGHNYVLEVTVSGDVDSQTGMLVDLGKLDEAVQRCVLDRYDHRNMNVDIPELAGKITTSEVVATAIFDQLEGRLPARLEKVKLFETARNAFEVTR